MCIRDRNILDCEVIEQNGTAVATCKELTLPLPTDRNLQIGQNIFYGIRPEHLLISKAPIDRGAGSGVSGADISGTGVSGKVKVVEPTGPEIHVYTNLANQDICAITRERLSLQPADDIYLQPDLSYVHLFDGETKKAI